MSLMFLPLQVMYDKKNYILPSYVELNNGER